jgi:hypothetical protein
MVVESRRMLCNYMYPGAHGQTIFGSAEVTVEEAVEVFRKCTGPWANVYVVVDANSTAAWHKHGPHMFELRLSNHKECRRRIAQVTTEMAEESLRNVFANKLSLRELEEKAFVYSTFAWDPSIDPDYWATRSKQWPRRLNPNVE